MPKVVDHETRRTELAEAVWRLASREGLEALTMRGVAAEAGWSTGALNHYFSDKEDLLLFAFHVVADRSGGRLAGARSLREIVAALLPLEAESRAEVRVWFALLGLALSRPPLAKAQRDAYRACRGVVAEALREAQAAGEVDAGLDAASVAADLVAFADGLSIQSTFAPRAFPPARQLAMLDARLEAIAPAR